MEEEFKRIRKPDQIRSFFLAEKWTLLMVAVSGLIYNIGMIAGPWFEGKLAQRLCDILKGSKQPASMAALALFYILVLALVQSMRFLKRLYVRKFANHINRDMKEILYHNLLRKSRPQLEQESVGEVMTKAISDVDACAEGMRKFTTELFDTGVVMVSYLVMLLWYDWRITLLSLLFPPLAYILAKKLQNVVSASTAAYKKSTAHLNEATLDRVSHGILYRVYGQEENQNRFYETRLTDYEKKAVRANLWESSMPPIYQILSQVGTIMILWFGSRNILGVGWKIWDIAAFTTFLSCFNKLANKSSHAAKLFNTIQKALVSWKRIQPFMKEDVFASSQEKTIPAGELHVENLSFSYPVAAASRSESRKADARKVLKDISFRIFPGQIVGVTGPVACGKSTLGKLFLGEYSYEGHIYLEGEGRKRMELQEAIREGYRSVSYMGHEPELLSDTIEQNILLGDAKDAWEYLRLVCMDQEVKAMPQGLQTRIGTGGVRLSGGQQARIALARTLCHAKPLLILDDPFSAVDQNTERQIMENLQNFAKERIILLFSHRLCLFSQMDQVFWMESGELTASRHERLLLDNPAYAALYRTQTTGTPKKTPLSEAKMRNSTQPGKESGHAQKTGRQPEKQKQRMQRSLHRSARKSGPSGIRRVLNQVLTSNRILSAGLILAVAGAVVAAILPPLVLERIINRLTDQQTVSFYMVLLYFGLLTLTGLLDATREFLITRFGQKITHGMRSEMCRKLVYLPASYFVKNEPGAITSRFVNDVDTVEELFASGMIGMIADTCKVFSILLIIFIKSRGLGILMLLTTPLLFAITRAFQKRMLKAQMENRRAVARSSNLVPETLQCIRMIHTLSRETFMEKRYDASIQAGYQAMEKNNFYNAIYSPIIIMIRTLLIALMMTLAARGGIVSSLFGMSVGTSVAIITYVGKVFSPLESIGMEIQSIQSAIAGVFRIRDFLEEKERCPGQKRVSPKNPAIRLEQVVFGYEEAQEVLHGESFDVQTGETVTLTGRTGAGKSTVFKLILGLYLPWSGSVEIQGVPAQEIADQSKRRLFGYVEQSVSLIPGTIEDQITLKDPGITKAQVEKALKLADLWDTIQGFPKKLDTPCVSSLFSQGQMQLLSIARAVAANPDILLLDEITANLDSATEKKVLEALKKASLDRTVLSISHRLYESGTGRQIRLHSDLVEQTEKQHK